MMGWAKICPSAAMIAARTTSSTSDCLIACAASPGWLAPMARATSTVVPMATAASAASTMNMICSAVPTPAMATAPSLPTMIRSMMPSIVWTGLVGQALQFPRPEAAARAVAAPAVSCDQQPVGGGVACPSVALPPAPDALHGEGRRVAVQAHVDPARVGGQVVDAVGRRSSPLWEHEVIHPYLLRFPVGSPFAPPVLEIPHQLLLLGVHRDHGVARLQVLLRCRIYDS